MPDPRSGRSSPASTSGLSAARRALIARLEQPPRLTQCGPAGRSVVTAIRILAAHSSRGSDALPDLLRHFGDVHAMRCFLGFADAAGEAWPERVQVLRPCCGLASPDEVTLAALVTAAARGSRAAFVQQIDGLVPAARHDALFDAAVRLAASLPDAAGGDSECPA